MKTQNLFSVLVALVVVFGSVGCVTKNNVTVKGSSPRFFPGTTNVYYETFEYGDKSIRILQPEGSGGGNNIRFGFSVGGGVPVGNSYGYGANPGIYGYQPGSHYVRGLVGPQSPWHPSVLVPIESQGYYQEETWRKYYGESIQQNTPPPNFRGGRVGRYGY